MTALERKSFDAAIDVFTPPSDDKPYGGFVAVASDDSLDRDGERLYLSEWVTPLPQRITLDVDHGMTVGTTIGSARPYFDGDRLMIDATFSSLDRAQEVRTLVREGHISTVSVAALVDRSQKTPRRELLNVGIVAIPANPHAVIMDAKAFGSAVTDVLNGVSVAAVIKAAGGDAVAMVNAIHDASVHLGAECLKSYDPDELDDDGEGVGNDDYDDSGDEDGANKALRLRALALRAKALSR
ncbi:hypothetical protein TUM20983_27930 [Mycobacterium antarcticum]|uniref:hypothetical protein n=1 Tax=unclassified Mycolicibacterium TaxID=2636767 RepID=UPI00239FB806|nr:MULTISPECIES: hypothetical protein [unclassified Mycolicibacterium]GLP75683.1 hypothetical protein TUM20983_27930 [Mycolicibacterium sp. TUM20983]GLP83974.1 hypothetical protein TUM20984_53940 [Mycolicibacterium sp. TUM20984]